MASGPTRIGHKYVKAQYREYVDASFSKLRYGHQSRTNPASLHLGLLGPVIKAAVGDTVRVHFLNRAGFPANLVPAGPLAGAAADAAVADGATKTFEWVVPAAAGPGSAEDSSVVWAYGSTVDRVRDAASGLFGVVIVTRTGGAQLLTEALPESGELQAGELPVRREFVLGFLNIDEGKSHFLQKNIQKYTTDPASVRPPLGAKPAGEARGPAPRVRRAQGGARGGGRGSRARPRVPRRLPPRRAAR